MAKIHLILILLFSIDTLFSQIPDSTVLKEAEHSNFLKQVMDNYIKSDSMKMKAEKLNILRRENVLLTSHYIAAANIKDTVKMNNIKIEKKLNEDSSLAIIGLSNDSLISYRKVFETIEVTVFHYKDHSLQDLRSAENTFIQTIRANLFVILPQFYERAYIIQKKMEELQIDVYVPPEK